MIKTFKMLGRMVLEKNGFYNLDDSETSKILKRKELLYHQSLIPKYKNFKLKGKKGEDNIEPRAILDGRCLKINFHFKDDDIENDKDYFEILLSDFQLSEEVRDKLFLAVQSPKSKKKYLFTNTIFSLATQVFEDSVTGISAIRKKKKSGLWFEDNVIRDYDLLMKRINDTFYVTKSKKIEINRDMLKDDSSLHTEVKGKYDEKSVEDYLCYYINNKYFGVDNKNSDQFPSFAYITIDNEDIYNYESGKYADSYINICYYDYFKVKYIEESVKQKKCHSCNRCSDLSKSVSIPFKFYGTTNYLNFGDLDKNNTYRSFALCENCYHEVLTGMKYIGNYFSKYLFGLQCYIIPKSDDIDLNIRLVSRLQRVIEQSGSLYSDEIDTIKKLLKKAKKQNVYIDFLFYSQAPGSAQFDVNRYITNVDLNLFLEKLDFLDVISKAYYLDKMKYDESINIKNIRYYLFASKMSYENPDYSKYGKELLDFLAKFMKNEKISYSFIINSFIKIYLRIVYRNDHYDRYAPFKIVLFMKCLIEFKQLKIGGNMKRDVTTEILNENYEQYFENHKEVYENNTYKQGLFLLGTVISRILYAQHKAGINGNFMKKLKMNGIQARRIHELVLQVKDYEEIYKNKRTNTNGSFYSDIAIWGQIFDRIEGIENSHMTPQETVFYILSGVSYEDYLGFLRGQKKKQQEIDEQQGE